MFSRLRCACAGAATIAGARTECVDQGHGLLRGWARRGGWRGSVGRCRAPPAVAAVEPLQASSVCGVMARQGRCVAEAGVRDAASRAASKHAEAWVCPPASFPWPPFGSDSLSSVPPPLPGVPFVRAPTPGGAAGRRPDVGRCASGRNAPAGSFATGPGDSQASTRIAVDVRVDGYRPLRGLPYIEAAQRAATTTSTPRRRAGSWCVSGSSASAGWTRRPSAGTRNREIRGPVGRERLGRPDPERRAEAGRKNLTVRWQVWSSARATISALPNTSNEAVALGDTLDAESGGRYGACGRRNLRYAVERRNGVTVIQTLRPGWTPGQVARFETLVRERIKRGERHVVLDYTRRTYSGSVRRSGLRE